MGTVYLVGAGPGDPGLITCKGIELIKSCDVVIYDRLVSDQLLDYLKKDCVRIYVGKEPGHHSKKQEEINQIIVDYARQYEMVVRLKGGDPFVFGRGGEEIEELMKYGIPFEVVPGVTSAISVPASAGIPVTHRGLSRSFHVITGHTKDSDNTLTDNYEVLAKLDGTLVFLMGLSNLEQITEQLIHYGKDPGTSAAVISNGTMQNAITVRGTLSDITEKVKTQEIISPAIIVIGETAALHFVSQKAEPLTYIKSLINIKTLTNPKPLSNVKVGITGTTELREKLWNGLKKAGAEVYPVCEMKVCHTEFIPDLEAELKQLEKYQWIMFTSQNAIHLFFELMKTNQIDHRKLHHVKFAVIGSGTGQTLQSYGYIADFIPEKYTSKDLAYEFSAFMNGTVKVLIPRAFRGSEELTGILRDNHIDFKEIPIYDVKGNLTNEGLISDMDCLVFASASGVNAFFDEVQSKELELKKELTIACMGEVTGEELRNYQRNADIVANVSNTDGLIDQILEYYQNRI